jgi:hypothetical protein
MQYGNSIYTDVAARRDDRLCLWGSGEGVRRTFIHLSSQVFQKDANEQ